MSKTGDYVARNIYAQHVQGRESRRYLNSPVDNRSAVLERFYRRKLTEMSIARFKWENMPPTVDTLFLERVLFESGLAIFLNDPRFDAHMVTKATVHGQPNYTDNPTKFRLFGAGGYPSTPIDAKNCVPIWGSITRTPDLDAVLIYSQKFAELDRTIEINSKNARRTKVLVASKDEELTMSNVDRALEAGDPAIYARDKGQDLSAHEKVTAIDLGIDMQHVERLHILKVRLWNECMTYLGIDGGNQDKKERQITSEVEANEEQVNLMKETALATRKIAAEQINRKYGLDVSVGYRTDNGATLERII